MIAHAIRIQATSFAFVATVVAPVALLCWWWAKHHRPEQKPLTAVPATPEVILLAFVFVVADVVGLNLLMQPAVLARLVSPEAATILSAHVTEPGVQMLLGNVAAMHYQPLISSGQATVNLTARAMSAIVVTIIMLARLLQHDRSAWKGTLSPRLLWFTLAIWFVVCPVVLTLHALATIYVSWSGGTIDIHPLSTIGANWKLAPLFLASACLATPIFEEWFVRGLLLPWAVQSQSRSHILILLAAMLALLGGQAHVVGVVNSLVVVLLLIVGIVFGQADAETRRAWLAIVATSALFAAMHTTVWPTPIPLFVFSLALGWLAWRTGGITASVIVHGLLNAVSAIYVLRGGPLI